MVGPSPSRSLAPSPKMAARRSKRERSGLLVPVSHLETQARVTPSSLATCWSVSDFPLRSWRRR